MKKKKAARIWRIGYRQTFIFLFILLTFSLLWVVKNFGNIGLNEIMFTLNMPLKGTSVSFWADYFLMAALPSVLFFLAELVFLYYPYKNNCYFKFSAGARGFRLKVIPLRMPFPVFFLFLAAWFAVLFLLADSRFGVLSYVRSQMMTSDLIEEEYVSPNQAGITFPERKRNLICIYVESLESSVQDQANGGLFDVNYIPELTQIAKENVSFSHSDLIEGAAVSPASGWTVAGLVAETAGLPLKLFEYSDRIDGADNSMERYEYFLPGAVTLGDILKREGYRNFIMFGSLAGFGGRDTYFAQHGDYEIWDYISAREEKKIPSDYYENWGFEDEKLYEFAREKILELAASGQPFHFSMLTADTHTPDGYTCRLCPDIYEKKYANVLACASAQLNQFLEWAKRQDFYENTTIVIFGDHCSMVADFFGEYSYDKHNGETVRKVYNAFINSAAVPERENNRKFTTMDLFPSIIASLGGEIEGNRLGLGTNLFSGEQTLAEKYGYEVFFEELNKRSVFYNQEILYPRLQKQ